MQALEYGEKFYKRERIDSELPIAALNRQLVSIHDSKNKKYKLSDFCLFYEDELERSLSLPASVANTFFTLLVQKKMPNWVLGCGLDEKIIRKFTNSDFGYTSPRAWLSEIDQVFFVSPYFFARKLIVSLGFFGYAPKRTETITLFDVDSGIQCRVHLGDLRAFRGYADKEIFNQYSLVNDNERN